MYRPAHKLLLTVLLCLCARGLWAQEALLGLFQSPRGVGLTGLLSSREGREMDILTLRTDFYGVLSGRTAQSGVCLQYTHDYNLMRWEGEEYRLQLHAGAGGMIGFVHDFEQGVFSAYLRDLEKNPGGVAALAGNIGLRADFLRRISLDVSLTILPGIHMRTDKSTGALLASFYRGGVFHAFYPQLVLYYRFR